MQILSVELENVKSYEREEVRFTGGVNAIVGHNGAGKSTILEAIGFVLFDTLGYNHKEFIRSGAKSARVRVSFVSGADERVYDVERRIGSGGHYYVHDPELGARICEGRADVLKFLRQHMQVEPSADLASIFRDAVGVPQGTLTAAFLLSDADRKRVFESLLRVEEYSKVWEKLREPLNLLKTRKGEVDQEISHLKGRLERMPALESRIAERKNTIKATREELSKAVTELDSVQEVRAKLECARDEVRKAERALLEVQRELQTLQAHLQAAEQKRAEAEAAKKLVDDHQEGHKAFLEAEALKQRLDEQLRQRQQLQMQAASVEKRVAQIEAEAHTLQQQLEKVAEAEKLKAELHDAVIEQTRLEGVLAEARQQQARLEDAKRAAAQQQEQLTRQQARHADLARQLAEAQEIDRLIQETTAQTEARRKELDAERDVLARLKSQAELIKEQSQRLEDVQTAVCPVCEQPLTPSHREEMLTRNNNRLEEMRARYRTANSHVQALEKAVQQEEASLKKWQAALLKLPRADEAQKLAEEIERLQAQLDQAKSQVAALASAAEQVEATSAALEALGNPRLRYQVAVEQAGQRATLEAKLAQKQAEAAGAQEELSKLKTALGEFGDLDAQVDAVAATLQQHRAAHDTVLANLRQAEALEAHAQEAARLEQEVATLAKRCAEAERTHQEAAANFDEKAYLQAVGRAEELQQQVGTLRGEMNTLEKNQESDEAELAELRALTADVAVAEAKLKRLADEEEVLETIRQMLRQAGPYISEALNRQISDGARQIFSDLMQDYSRHLTWNKDYSITLEVDGRERNFSQLSGGEQMSAALSVRLALLREMSSIDIAFFDEPTANLDEVRREALARQILNVRGFRQLFVISHDDTFEQATQNLIRVERVDGASRVLA